MYIPRAAGGGLPHGGVRVMRQGECVEGGCHHSVLVVTPGPVLGARLALLRIAPNRFDSQRRERRVHLRGRQLEQLPEAFDQEHRAHALILRSCEGTTLRYGSQPYLQAGCLSRGRFGWLRLFTDGTGGLGSGWSCGGSLCGGAHGAVHDVTEQLLGDRVARGQGTLVQCVTKLHTNVMCAQVIPL
eukprot:7189903-Pyramimonas_sp.AAC.1